MKDKNKGKVFILASILVIILLIPLLKAKPKEELDITGVEILRV